MSFNSTNIFSHNNIHLCFSPVMRIVFLIYMEIVVILYNKIEIMYVLQNNKININYN